jgi:hypothetical protein
MTRKPARHVLLTRIINVCDQPARNDTQALLGLGQNKSHGAEQKSGTKTSCPTTPNAEAQHFRVRVYRCRMYELLDDERCAWPVRLRFASIRREGLAYSTRELAVDRQCILPQLGE